MNEKECKDFRMHVPSSCLISGKSQSGKTKLLLTILSQWKYIRIDHSGKYTTLIYWFCGTVSIEQTNRVWEIFEDFSKEDGLGGHKDTNLQFVKVHTFKDHNLQMLLNEIHTAVAVSDYLINEVCSDEMITNVFSRECHLCMYISIMAKSISTKTICHHTIQKFPV